jgi:hypothetical protein
MKTVELFAAMKDRIEGEIVRYLMLLEPMTEEERREEEAKRRRQQEMVVDQDLEILELKVFL